jgi:uncharacterized protein (DUF58 family)
VAEATPRSAGPLAAQALAETLPTLLIEAERVAATVAQGLHGRRRVGTGENFWQFRPFVAGDLAARIDWRRSARSDQVFLRETEWDAAQTVALWRDAGPGMDWRSSAALPTKSGRVGLLLLALASLILRGGERVRLLDGQDGNAAGITAGSAALPRLAACLAAGTQGLPEALPPRHGQAVLFGDFLADPAPVRALISRLAALPARGALVQVLDPAEIAFPYAGRIRFAAPGGGAEILVPRADALRDAYRDRLRQRQDDLRRWCAGAGLALIVHPTDAAPQQALLALHACLSARR